MERTRITIFDTTLRDGEQSPGCSMNVQEKQKLARQLDRLGVDVIEAGFPIASDGDFTAVQSIAAEIRRPIICGLARAVPQDIERAWQALKGGLPLELTNQIRAGFLLHGVDIASWPGGFASAAHTDDDVARTVAAFESTFDMLAAESAL